LIWNMFFFEVGTMSDTFVLYDTFVYFI